MHRCSINPGITAPPQPALALALALARGDRSRATVARGGGTAGALGPSPQQPQPSRGPRGAGSEPWWDGNTDSSSSPRAGPRERRSGHWHGVMGKVPLSNGKRLGVGGNCCLLYHLMMLLGTAGAAGGWPGSRCCPGEQPAGSSRCSAGAGRSPSRAPRPAALFPAALCPRCAVGTARRGRPPLPSHTRGSPRRAAKPTSR